MMKETNAKSRFEMAIIELSKQSERIPPHYPESDSQTTEAVSLCLAEVDKLQ